MSSPRFFIPLIILVSAAGTIPAAFGQENQNSGDFQSVQPLSAQKRSISDVSAPEESLQTRLQQLEAEVQWLREQRFARFAQTDRSIPPAPIDGDESLSDPAVPLPQEPSYQDYETGLFGFEPLGSRMSGPPAGMGSPPPPTPAIPNECPADMPSPKFTTPAVPTWGSPSGFQIQTQDGEFTLQIHNLTQFDYRAYNHTADIPNNQVPNQTGASGPNDTFTFPRAWLIFNGTLTKNWEWMLAPSFQFDNVNLLDAWMNMHYDDRLQIKAGRYKTPFTYEFYTEPIQGLINPERSLFFNNFGLNRQVGIMAHGTVFDKYADYAIGVYNGQRNGFLSNSDSKDVAGYFNLRPFMNSGSEALERIDVGASFDVGHQNNPAAAGSPTVLRTNVATSGNLVNGVEFLQFAPTVRERGERALASAHAAYYYRQLSLISEFQWGTEHYTNSAPPPGGATSARIPITSWYVQSGYFLTGETTTFRNTVKPLHPFTSSGGTGAIELAGRYNYLNIGDEIYAAGLVDATGGNQWTNRVDLMDLGVNWYPNQWLKISGTWEHAWFASPVTYRAGQTSRSNDMLMIRSQIWF